MIKKLFAQFKRMLRQSIMRKVPTKTYRHLHSIKRVKSTIKSRRL